MKLNIRKILSTATLLCILLTNIISEVRAQQSNSDKPRAESSEPISDHNASTKSEASPVTATERERMLLERIEQLERRLAEIESRISVKPAELSQPVMTKEVVATSTASPAKPAEVTSQKDEDRSALEFFRDTTINVTLDGYYGYNFNRPVDRVNLLRAYEQQLQP